MKILSKYLTTATQIHNGKCYLLGLVSDYDVTANDIESGGSAAAGNQIMQIREGGPTSVILPKPGIECSNGLYVAAPARTTVFYSI